MKCSWIQTYRRLGATAIVCCATTFSSAMCYAMQAFDSASDPVYADGWQAGDNGGFGFTPWNFDARYDDFGQYANPGFKAIDDGLRSNTPTSSAFNNIGRAWAMGATPNDDGSNHVGRGFQLGVGETLRVTIDNPTVRQFFKGYFVRLNGGTGGVNGNLCSPGPNPCSPGGTPSPKLNILTFEYFTNGAWSVIDAANSNPGMFDTDTAAAGAEINVKRTGVNNYDLLFRTLDGNKQFAAAGRTFESAGTEVDWIEFVFFNPPATVPATDSNFFISKMSIVPEPGSATLLVLTAGTLFGAARSRRRGEK